MTKEARGVVYSEHWITSSSTSLSVSSPLWTLLLFPAAELFPNNHRLSFSPLFTAFLCTTKAWQKQHQENDKRMKAMYSFSNLLIHSELAYHFLGAQLLLQNHTVQTRRLTFSSFSTLLPVFTILLTVANVLKNLLDAPIPHKSSLSFSLSEFFFSWSHTKNLRNLSLRELFLPLVSHEEHLNSLCFSCVSPLSLLHHIHCAQITETNRTNFIALKNSNSTVERRYLSVAGCKNSN